MTTNESRSRDCRTIQCIQTMFCVHQQLRQYASAVQVSIEDAVLVLRGQLPSGELKQELIPAIRQAGFLGRVCDLVVVDTNAA